MGGSRTSPLTLEEIFAKALEIIDAEGAKALSMRRLAGELGVEAMSLYHHVPNKDALLDGVVKLALSTEPSAPYDPSAPWQQAVAGALAGFRRALVAHPNALPLMIESPPMDPESSATYVEGPLRFLLMQGVPESNASQLYEALLALSFGHAALSVNYGELAISGLPRVDFTEASFERGVRVLLDGYAPAATEPSSEAT